MSAKATIPIVDVTCFGRNISIEEYAKNALEWAKKELVPKGSIYCPCLGGDVYFSNKKVQHTIMHKKFNQQSSFNIDNISIISEIEQILNNAILRYATLDNKGRDNIIRIYKLLGEVNLNEVVRDVELLIQEIYHPDINENRFHFYNHILL
jgi:hypothetical protein